MELDRRRKRCGKLPGKMRQKWQSAAGKPKAHKTHRLKRPALIAVWQGAEG